MGGGEGQLYFFSFLSSANRKQKQRKDTDLKIPSHFAKLNSLTFKK